MLTPDKYAEASVYDLLQGAARGLLGLDQRWAHAIADRGVNAVPDINRFGAEDHFDDPVDLSVELLQIVRYLRAPEAVPFLVEFARSGPEDLPDEFVDAVYTVREAALEPFLKLYGELEEDEAGDVAFTLAALRIRDDRVLAILLDRLEYDLTEGALCLGLYGDPAAVPALERMLSEIEEDDLRRALESALGEIASEPDDYEPAFDLYEQFPEKAAPDTSEANEQDLIEMLRSSDPEYRLAAVNGLNNREMSDEVRALLFRSAREDEDAALRGKSWEALSDQIEDHEEIYQAMLSRLQDETAPEIERAGALTGLGQKANIQPIRAYAEQFYKNPATRAAALSAMWNSLDRTFAPFFPPHLDDADMEMRKHAISGVGYLGIHESATKLRTLFEDEDLRHNALFAYALAVRTDVSPSRMRSLQRKIDELAGGLTVEEEELVQLALDERLLLHGHKPIFHPGIAPDLEPSETGGAPKAKVGRNDPCPCGSGKKYKKCCGA